LANAAVNWKLNWRRTGGHRLRLRDELEEVQRQVDTLKGNYLGRAGPAGSTDEELQAAQAPVDQKVKSLTEALAWETQTPGSSGTIGS